MKSSPVLILPALFSSLVVGACASDADDSPKTEAIRTTTAELAVSSTIHEYETAQYFRGWGTNINILSGALAYERDTNPRIAEKYPALLRWLSDRLFDSETGVGFNAVRAFARTGQNPEIVKTYAASPKAEAAAPWVFGKPWMRQDGTWISDYDPVQMDVLAGAKARGVDIWQLRGQGAPWWMTISKDAGGNGPDPNLARWRYPDYTDYLAAVANRLTALGYPISSVSAMEEELSPPILMPGQKYTRPSDFVPAVSGDRHPQEEICHELRMSLNRRNLDSVAIVGPNEASPGGGTGTFEALSGWTPFGLKQIDTIGTHGYQATEGLYPGSWAWERLLAVRQIADSVGKDIEVNEDDSGRVALDGGDQLTWDFAIRMAYKAAIYMNQLRMTQWYVWNPGPRLAWFDGEGNVVLRPQYYVLKFLAHSMPAGSRMLKVDDRRAIVGVSPLEARDRKLHLVVVNEWDKVRQSHSFTLPFKAHDFAFTERTITESTAAAPAVVEKHANDKTIELSVPPNGMVAITVDLHD
jgi:hypothetical protein